MNLVRITLFLFSSLVFLRAGVPAPDFEGLCQTWSARVVTGKGTAGQYHWEASMQLGDQLIRGKQAIAVALAETQIKPRDYELLGHVAQDDVNHISYGRYQSDQGPVLQVTYWKFMLQRHWRIFDLVVPQETQQGRNRAIIDRARQRWMKTVNGKDANQFVTQMFENDGRQLYGFELNDGHPDLLQFYSYLNGDDYGFNLEAHQVWAIKPKGAVEIGRYSGQDDMSGWYILLWRIQNGEAKIALDFSQ